MGEYVCRPPGGRIAPCNSVSAGAKTALKLGEMLGTVEGVQWGVIFAAATVQLVPVLALVVALQRYLVAGLTAGAVKA